MATGRSNGRPRTPKGKQDFIPDNLTPEMIAKIPNPPNDLNEDGQVLWYRIWSGGKDWLADADFTVVQDLCQIFQEKEIYRRAIDLGSVPRVYKMPNGTMAPHPYVNLLKSSRQEMTVRLSSIGFTPTDRAKLEAIESLADEEFMAVVHRKANNVKKREERLNGTV